MVQLSILLSQPVRVLQHQRSHLSVLIVRQPQCISLQMSSSLSSCIINRQKFQSHNFRRMIHSNKYSDWNMRLLSLQQHHHHHHYKCYPYYGSYHSTKYYNYSTTTTTTTTNCTSTTTSNNNTTFSSNTTTTTSYPINVAIVGSGPSGCYTAKYLIKAFQSLVDSKNDNYNLISDVVQGTANSHSNNNNENDTPINNQQPTSSKTITAPLLDTNNNSKNNTFHLQQIDIIERLPTPYGLVRYGVAPDHPEVKNVQNDFNLLFEEYNNNQNENITSTNNKNNINTPILNFCGNINVGVDISIMELRKLYDIVILCYGCADSDRTLSFQQQQQPQNNNSSSVLSAREFVAWYNGHPHYNHIGDRIVQILQKQEQQQHQQNQSMFNVVIVGHGNVALDCARILAKCGSTTETSILSSSSSSLSSDTTNTNSLYHTDISLPAYNILQQYPFTNIIIVGRRGHVQASFTIKELRELINLQNDGYIDTSFVVQKEELDMCTSTIASQNELNGPNGRPKQRIDKLLREAATNASNISTERQVQLRFLLNPIQLEVCPTDPSSIQGVVCERNTLIGDAGSQKAIGTGLYEAIPANMVLVSIGYKGIPLPDIEQWFDTDHGTIRNDRGHVDSRTMTLGGLYASGWIKRGPHGIIGTNIMDAKETVATIMADIQQWNVPYRSNDLKVDLYSIMKQRGIQVVDWQGYRRIEAKEFSIRRSEHQPREKIVNLKDQLAVAFFQ